MRVQSLGVWCGSFGANCTYLLVTILTWWDRADVLAFMSNLCHVWLTDSIPWKRTTCEATLLGSNDPSALPVHILGVDG